MRIKTALAAMFIPLALLGTACGAGVEQDDDGYSCSDRGDDDDRGFDDDDDNDWDDD